MEEGAEELMDNPIQKSNVKKLRDHMKSSAILRNILNGKTKNPLMTEKSCRKNTL